MLETAAAQAGQRGDAATAMAAFERAARLTANEAARGAYLIRARGNGVFVGGGRGGTSAPSPG